VRALFTLAILAAASVPAEDLGPTQLIVTYRCPPPRRAAFRQYMGEYGLQRFDRWKQDGVLAEYKFLFNWYIDVDTWDAMAILTFPDYGAVARWKDIEKASPGGLPRDALEMAWPLNSYPADLLNREVSDSTGDRSKAVYFIRAYDSKDAMPPLRSFLRDGVLSSSVYVNRYPGGKRWQAMILFEYRDMDAFARTRPETKAGEREPVIADAIGK
jgi:hypothetical protein